MRAPDFWDRKTDGILPTVLRPLGCVIAGLTALRVKSGTPYRASVPVICVGNLVAGGAGKTPVALDLAQRLTGRGLKPHVVTRGYGGKELGPVRVDPGLHNALDVGDEALLLARAAPTWVSRERPEGIKAAVADGADVIILDDGFQNPSVEKDLSLLVVDGGYGFGNGRVIPAGPLRETVPAGLARADAVVLMGADDADVWGRIQRLGFKDLAVLRAKLEPVVEADDLKGQEVYAFAGIGRPQKFFDTLKELGCRLAGCKAFDDHHPYTEAEVQAILSDAGGALPITTAKDWVRLPTEARDKVRVLDVTLAWKAPEGIDALLDKILSNDRSGDADG